MYEPETLTPEERLDDLTCDASRNARYHAKRASFLAFCNNALVFLIIVLGSAAFARFENLEHWFGLAIAVIGALTIVLDLRGKELEHRIQYRAYTLFPRDMARAPKTTETDLADLEARFREIEAEERTLLYNALNAVCHNEVMIALGRPKARLAVPALDRWLAHVHAFSMKSYDPVK